MTMEIPQPGSVWRYRIGIGIGIGQARVIYASPDDVIAHNCEVADDPTYSIVSWRGDVEFFHQCFAPGNPDFYPRTAF